MRSSFDRRLLCIVLAWWAGTGAATALADSTIVTFDAGAQGWSGPGGSTVIEPAGGNPGAHMHTVFNNFGISFVNSTNPQFVFDYTQVPEITLGIDVQVESIFFFNTEVPRPWLVELRDTTNPPGGYPYVSVWYKFADISQAQHSNWTTFSVTIADTLAEELPPGWGGTGDETPQGEPMLPANRTFASVLAGVDQVAFTTLEPGFVFGFTDFDLRLDNISITTGEPEVPAVSLPGFVVLAVLLGAAGVLIARRRADALSTRA